jgi:ABC-2 type transport system ATP-binding protein
MTASMIEIKDLSKNYGETKALRGVNFEVPRGQVVGFLGPNGAGKTTAMRLLTGYIVPTSGGVWVDGVDVVQNPLEARKKIGYLAESNPLYEEMMVQEYLEYAAQVRRIAPSKKNAAISSAVERCGLGPVRGRDIGQLSKGFRQRVGLAHAILHDPDLLILDEPTSGLDPNQVLEIRNLIKDLGQEKTVLMSTHILPEVQATCSRVLIISQGEIVADDAPDVLTQQGGRIELELAVRDAAAISAEQISRILEQLPGVQDVTALEPEEEGAFAYSLRVGTDDPRRALFDAAIERGLILLRLDRQRISLEETFRRLTTREEGIS